MLTLTGAHERVCWTRMQAEAGEGLARIVRRKEVERQACDGLFFWGVGNPPARAIPALARMAAAIDVLFSVMKSKPKPQDVAPNAVVAWRSYVDASGTVRPLPSGVLVTSRAGRRNCHYALMCRSDTPLGVEDAGPFDPAAYRNYGAGGAVGNSQVTALLERCAPDGPSEYRVAMRAKLTGGLWVKLLDPVAVTDAARDALEDDHADWLDVVGLARSGPRQASLPSGDGQSALFPV